MSSRVTPRLDPERERRFFAGVEYATRFFMSEANVFRALEKIGRLLDEAQIPAQRLDPSVREKYLELRRAAQGVSDADD